MTPRILACLVVAVAMAGCGGSDSQITASDPAFAGLDQAVVKEVLDSKIARERVEGDEHSAAVGRYQGMVRNFVACRDALGVYQSWVKTGTAPKFPAQAKPANPAPFAEDMDREIDTFTKEVSSGDISLLRDHLTNQSGCGNWIPAQPGDESGATIADVVRGKQ